MQVRGVYWKNYAADRDAGHWPTARWYFNDREKLNVVGGDYICLFASGSAANEAEPEAGYLVQIMRVGSVRANDGEDSEYPVSEFQYAVLADPQHNLPVGPIWFDGMIRPRDGDPMMHIGVVRRSSWPLSRACIAHVTEKVQGFQFV